MSVYYQDARLTLLHGDAIEQVRTLDAGSVQTVVTSPPYFGLRDYGEDGQYGAEATVGEFVDRLVGLFREIRRVLDDDGTVWLNLGDSYDGGKSLTGAPWLTALALKADGWVLRSEVIWAKPNAMPESVADRPSKAHEHLFLLAKSSTYYYDIDATRVPHSEKSVYAQEAARRNAHRPGKAAGAPGQQRQSGFAAGLRELNPKGANRKTVWDVPTVPFTGGHFAVYPPALIRPCVLAGSRPGDTVLDPFSGSGTTGMVALQEGRKYVGIDLNADYLDLSLRERFQQQPLDIFGGFA